MIVFTQTDLPEPVAPAMSRCGIFARSAITGLPSRSLPSAMGSAARALWKSRDSISSRNATISGVGFGTSTPTAPRPGIGATMRMLGARMASARSFARFAIWRTFTPGAGSISNCVTTGPVVRPTSSPSTRNVRSASMSLTPIASSSRFPASLFCGGGGVEQFRRRQLVARQLGVAVASIAAAISSSRVVGSVFLPRRFAASSIAASPSRPRRRSGRLQRRQRIDGRHLLGRRLEREGHVHRLLLPAALGRRLRLLRRDDLRARPDRRSTRAGRRSARIGSSGASPPSARSPRAGARSTRRSRRTSAPVVARRSRPTARPRSTRRRRADRSAREPTATGRSTTTPARKIIHDRSVSDSSRPNRRSACTADERNQRGRRPAEQADHAATPGSSRRGRRCLRARPRRRAACSPRARAARPPGTPRTAGSAMPVSSRLSALLTRIYRSRSGPSLVICRSW